MKFEDVEALAWDLDGTLIDSFELYVDIISEMADRRGCVLPPREELLKNYHGSLDDTLSWTFQVNSRQEIDGLVKDFIDVQNVHYEHDVDRHFYEDAIKLARRADNRDFKQIVITNRDHSGRYHASPRSIIERSAIAGFIHEVRCGDEVGARKPDPRALGDWLVRHSIRPEGLLVVGDQFVDAKLAVNLGSRAVLAARNGDIPHIDDLISTHSERITVVKSLEEVEL